METKTAHAIPSFNNTFQQNAGWRRRLQNSSLGGVMRSSEVRALVEDQIDRASRVSFPRVVRPLLVEPRCEMREWDYGESSASYPCWIVMEHPPSNTAIAYCENGFGLGSPWGLLFIEGDFQSMGMDSAWFPSFEEAVCECAAWTAE